MKIIPILIISVALYSCTDIDFNDYLRSPNPVLKRIHYSNDTIYLLCGGCPPVIRFNAEDFHYDVFGRLELRRLTTTTLSPAPVKIDTTATYIYSYSAASNSPLITGYTDTHRGVNTVNHVLTYDNQNRLISDSVTNPQLGNNKVSLFQYLPGYVVEYDRQTNASLTEIVRDTLYISGNSIVQEKSINVNTHREITHTPSAYRNPLSYVNNFILFASDYKNEIGLTSFPIYFPQNITYDFPTQTLVKYWTNPASVTQYNNVFFITVDAQNRIESYRNSVNGKSTFFEYF